MIEMEPQQKSKMMSEQEETITPRLTDDESSTKRIWCPRNVLNIMGMIGMVGLIAIVPWSILHFRDNNRSSHQQEIDYGRDRLYYTCNDIFGTKMELFNPDVLKGYQNQDDFEKSIEQAAYHRIGLTFNEWKNMSIDSGYGWYEEEWGFSNLSYSNSTNSSNNLVDNINDDLAFYRESEKAQQQNENVESLDEDDEFDIFDDGFANTDRDRGIGDTIVTDGEVGTCSSL
jgi:hypothetical protein